MCAVCLLFMMGVYGQNRPLPQVTEAYDYLGKNSNTYPYDIEVDSNGYAYMSNRLGLVRFDGQTMHKINFVDDKKWFRVVHLIKGAGGRLLAMGQRNIGLIQNDSLVTIALPEDLRSKLHLGSESIYMDEQGTLHISPRLRGYYTYTQDGVLTEVFGQSSPDIRGFVVTRLDDGTPFHFSVVPKTPSNPDQTLSIYYLENGNLTQLTSTTHLKPMHTSSLCEHADGSLSLSIGHNDIYRFNNNSLIQHRLFLHRVIHLFVDSRDDLWVGTIDHGFFRCEHGDFGKIDQFWEDAAAVVAEGSDGSLWVKSESRSFGFISTPSIDHYSSATSHPHLETTYGLASNGKALFVLAPPGGMYKIDADIQYIPIEKQVHVEGDKISDVSPLNVFSDESNGRVWLVHSQKITSWDGSDWRSYGIKRTAPVTSSLLNGKVGPSGQVIAANRDRVFLLKGDSLHAVAMGTPKDVLETIEDSRGGVWVRRKDGTWCLNSNNQLKRPAWTEEAYKQILYSYFEMDGTLWASQNGGTLVQIVDGHLVPYYDGAGAPMGVRKHSRDSEGSIWMSTSRKDGSFHLFKLSKKQAGFALEEYGFNSWALSTYSWNSKSLIVFNDHLYWSSAQGLFVSPIKDLKPFKETTQTVPTYLHVNHVRKPMASSYQLESFENNLHIQFDGINFKQQTLEFRYKLIGHDSQWQISDYPQVQFTNLASGKYTFTVQGHAKHQTQWGPISQLQFNIATPFWVTWWFRGAIIAFSIGLLYTLLHLRLRHVRRKERMKADAKLEMARLELKALKAQINPHFIFNAMSSVSYYLAKNQANDAKNYLQRFTRLVRKVLENSEKPVLPLADEMVLIENYVGLESQRFKGPAIHLEIDYSQLNPKEVWIAPALFQPYVENAIWHGLKPKEGMRKLRIDFRKEGPYVHTCIQDNGIGRRAAEKLHSGVRNDRSFGMMIAARRIELLNSEYIQPTRIEDLHNADGTSKGTAVHLVFEYISKEPPPVNETLNYSTIDR